MRVRLMYTAIVLIASIIAASSVSCSLSEPDRLFGLSVDGGGESVSTGMRKADASLDRQIEVVNIYEAWEWRHGWPTDALTGIRSEGAVPEITWEPWDPREGPVQADYALSEITSGRYDTYISQWAGAAAVDGQPVYLRFAHEMNGSWYPWSVLRNGGSPAQYVAAYRHVRQIFEARGATNVQWVWSPNVIIKDDVDSLTASFPGRDVVDVIGVDGYPVSSTDPEAEWRTPENLFGPTLATVDSIARGIPIWINETGCGPTGGNKAQWVTDLFEYLRTTRVTGLLWFEVAAAGRPDWRLQTDAAAQSAARAGLKEW
jgi:hypothetical protein